MIFLNPIRLSMIIALSILVTGCSSSNPLSGKEDYLKLVNENRGDIFKNTQHAVMKTPALEIAPFKTQVAQIRLDGPVLELDNTLSNFLTYQTPMLSVGSYALDVIGRCTECKGYNRKIILPYVELFSVDNKPINAVNFGGYEPSYTQRISFDILKESRVFLLVAADNRSLGNGISYFAPEAYHNGTINLPLTILPNPEGDISLTLTKIE